MSNRVALVTGAARGIGKAYAFALLQRGWSVTLVDIDDVQETMKELVTQLGGDTEKRVYGISVDVTNTAQMEQALHKTKDHFGGFDLLVNNAGIAPFFFTNLQQVVNTNLTAVLTTTEMAIRMVTDSLKHPSEKPFLIVNTASTSGLVPADPDLHPVYVATKFGIVGFVRSLKFLAPKFNIRVNCICPATVDTRLSVTDAATVAFLNSEGRGGVIDPSVCAEALLMLIDNDSIAGEVVTVHPSVGPKVEPLDALGQYAYLGTWSFQKSAEVDHWVNLGIERIKSGEGWSS